MQESPIYQEILEVGMTAEQVAVATGLTIGEVEQLQANP